MPCLMHNRLQQQNSISGNHFFINRGNGQMASQPYEVKMDPSLAALGADRVKPALKRGAKSPATPRAAAPTSKTLGKKATEFVVKELLQGGKASAKEDQEAKDRHATWEFICGYKRLFKDLEHNRKVTEESPLPVLKKELGSLQGQLSDRAALSNAKAMFVFTMTGLHMINSAIPMHPIGPVELSRNLPVVATKMIYDPEKPFLESELKEITILYPWLFRPGPEMRILMGMYQMWQMVMRPTAGMVPPTAADASKEKNVSFDRSQYQDL